MSMTKLDYFKLYSVLFVFFYLDFLRPWSFNFQGEFLFLGIIFVAFRCSLFSTLVTSLVWGLIKDLFFPDYSFYVLFFLTITLFIKYTLKHLHPKPFLKIILLTISIIFYSLLNSLVTPTIDFLFLVNFFIQSITVFYITNYFLLRWIHGLSKEQERLVSL